MGSPASASGGTGAPAGAGAGAGGTAPGTPGTTGADGWVSIRDAARGYGYDLGGVADDHQALQTLILQAQRARQLEQMAQYGQLYMQHAGQFQQWQREQQEAAARQQQQAQQWFKAPEWQPEWRNLITRDPQTGEYKPVPGAPPDIVQKYLTGLQHQQAFLERFSFDPIGAIKPGIEQIAAQMAQQIVQQQLGGYKDQSFAQGFIQQHSGWLYQCDANGAQIRDAMGQPVLSQWGQLFRNYVAEAARAGIANEEQRASYAMRMVRGDYQAYQLQQFAQQNAGDAGKNAFLQNAQAAHAAQTPAAVAQPAVNPGQAAQAANRRVPKVPLSERIKKNFAAAGITEQSFKAQAPAR